MILAVKIGIRSHVDVAKLRRRYQVDSSDDSEQTFAYMRPFVAAYSTEIKAVYPPFRSSAVAAQIFRLMCPDASGLNASRWFDLPPF
jgi:hypothetical protein